MSEYENVQDGQKKSDFNSGMLMNFRLDNILQKINYIKVKGSFLTWNSYLDSLWCELAADVKPTEKLTMKELEKGEDYERQFKNINIELSRVSPILNWNETKKGFESYTPLELRLKRRQYELLMKKEIFLRRQVNIQGKGTKYQDDASDYMDG